MFNLKSKKTLIILLLLASLASLTYILLSTKRSNPPKTELPPPSISSPIEEPLNIKSNLSPDKISIPPSLLVYSINSTSFSPTEMAQISTKFGFTSQSTILKDANIGEVYFWINDEASLRISPSRHFFDFQKNSPLDLDTPFPSNESLLSTAETFIKDIIQSTTDIKLTSSHFISLDEESAETGSALEVSKSNAQLIEIQYTQILKDYDVINNTTNIGTINIKLARDGSVYSVYADTITSISEYKTVPLKSYNELVSSLPTAKLESLDQGNIDLLSLPTIKQISIDQAKIAYFKEYSSTSNLLQPIFVLTGSALLDDTTAVPALLYLPATKN